MTFWGPADSNAAQINLARMSSILSLGGIEDHTSSLISLPALIPGVFFVAFQTSAIIFPVSYPALSSLQLSVTSLSSLPHSSLFAAPLFPNKNRKDLSQVTAGQQKVSSQDDRMLRSLPAALASTHPTIQRTAQKALPEPKCGQLITLLTTSTSETSVFILSLIL